MQLVPVQVLTPVVASGVALWGVGATLPGERGDGLRRFGGVVGGLAFVAVVLWGAFLLMGTMLESSPELLPVVLVALIAVLGLLPFVFRPRPPKPPEPAQARDDDGGGGLRKPEPTPRPTPPAPAAPEPAPDGPALAWDDFDALRSDWERVPVGTP